MLPTKATPDVATFEPRASLRNALLVTVEPEQLSRTVLASVDSVIAVGDARETSLRSFARAVQRPEPRSLPRDDEGEAWLWSLRGEPIGFRPLAPRAQHLRHRRKYADGDLGPDRSFYFRGPGARLNLRAQNVAIFVQLAEGVDPETWLHHLQRGDYSRWFREEVKDDALAVEIATIEREQADSIESRDRVLAAIGERYTGPA
jgi:hypothetical protein